MKIDVFVFLLVLAVPMMVKSEEVNQTANHQPEADHQSKANHSEVRVNHKSSTEEERKINRMPEDVQGSEEPLSPAVNPESKVTKGSEVEEEVQPQKQEKRENETGTHGGAVDDEVFFRSLEGLSSSIKNLLHGKDLSQLGALDHARTIVVSFPQSQFLGSLMGLGGTWANSLASIIIFGWPLFLLLLYVALVVVYPNRRSDNLFEKHLSSMVESWSHMLYAAEDNFLNFMEDVTDPGNHGHGGHHAGVDYSDPYNRQAVIYSPTAFYDEDGEHFDAAYLDDVDYEEAADFDGWGNPKPETTFIDPGTDFINPVVSFSPESPEPLREEYSGDILRLTNDFNLQNEISQKDQQNFLSVVLGTQYQHTKPSSSLVNRDVVRGSVATDMSHHPEPPKDYRPSHSTEGVGDIQSNVDVDPRFNASSHFRPSALIEQTPVGGGDWVAGPRPSRDNVSSSRTSQVARPSKIRFPGPSDSRVKSGGYKTLERDESVEGDAENDPTTSSSLS